MLSQLPGSLGWCFQVLGLLLKDEVKACTNCIGARKPTQSDGTGRNTLQERSHTVKILKGSRSMPGLLLWGLKEAELVMKGKGAQFGWISILSDWIM